MTRLKIRSQLSLLIAFLLGGTLLAGGYGLLSLKQAQSATDHSLDASAQILQSVESARTAQVAFKSQITEFKNLLLRGQDQEQYEWYLDRFNKGGAAVVSDLDALATEMSTLGFQTEAVVEARRLHGVLVQDHRDALKSFGAGNPESALLADRMVRGKDRLLDDRIGAIVHDLQQAAAARAEQLRQQSKEQNRRLGLFLGGLWEYLWWWLWPLLPSCCGTCSDNWAANQRMSRLSQSELQPATFPATWRSAAAMPEVPCTPCTR